MKIKAVTAVSSSKLGDLHLVPVAAAVLQMGLNWEHIQFLFMGWEWGG